MNQIVQILQAAVSRLDTKKAVLVHEIKEFKEAASSKKKEDGPEQSQSFGPPSAEAKIMELSQKERDLRDIEDRIQKLKQLLSSLMFMSSQQEKEEEEEKEKTQERQEAGKPHGKNPGKCHDSEYLHGQPEKEQLLMLKGSQASFFTKDTSRELSTAPSKELNSLSRRTILRTAVQAQSLKSSSHSNIDLSFSGQSQSLTR